MLCALTVRKLKPGTFEQFRVAFTSFDDADSPLCEELALAVAFGHQHSSNFSIPATRPPAHKGMSVLRGISL